MADQDNTGPTGKHTRPEQTPPELISVRKDGNKKDFLDITALIRSIQRAEGNPDCFRRAEGQCDQIDCYWRLYCLEGQRSL